MAGQNVGEGSARRCRGLTRHPEPGRVEDDSQVSAVVLQPAGRRGPSLGAAAGRAGGRLAALLGKHADYSKAKRSVSGLSRECRVQPVMFAAKPAPTGQPDQVSLRLPLLRTMLTTTVITVSGIT